MTTAPPQPADVATPPEQRFTTAELELGGMHCSACATRIQRSLARLPAVASASVNLATDRAFVAYDPDGSTPRNCAGGVRGRLHRRPGRGPGRRAHPTATIPTTGACGPPSPGRWRSSPSSCR